jgi:hypothetical protein
METICPQLGGSPSSSYSSPASTGDHSNQDWVCLKCNNLNFSFRKKCNRCKVQSREDNQQTLYADYYFYNHYYAYNSHSQSAHTPEPSAFSIEHPLTPTHKTTKSEPDLNDRDDHLPSVSPLVKKYGSGQEKRLRGDRGLFLWKLFGEESWSDNEIPQVNQCFLHKDLSLTDDEEPTAEFTWSVEQMII